jgi:type I restriction enzyme, S subunit
MGETITMKPFLDLLSVIIDNRGKTCPTSEDGIPLIATNCISNNYLYPRAINVRYVSDETKANWFRGHPVPNDMIFVTKGTPGRVAWVPDPVDFCIAQDMVAIRANPKKVYPKYLFAALRSKAVQSQIEGLHVGSLIPHFKKGDFGELMVPLPDKPRQEFIGDFYFDVCLKIDLLLRQNETLESLAETLFRHWFIDGAEDDWEVGKVSDLFELQRGYDLPVQNRRDGSFPILAASGLSGFHNEFRVKAPCVTTGRSGLLGKVFYISEDFWPLNTSLFIKEFVRGTPLFSYFFLKTLDLASFNAGSAVPTLNRNHVHDHEVQLPPKELPEQFDTAVGPNFKKIERNNKQIAQLEQLRDTLLPKLMSGEVRVEYEVAA